jgi:hypothetical protein
VYEFYSSSPITGFLLAGYIGTTLYRARENPFQKYTDREFKNRYRFTKAQVENLYGLLGNEFPIENDRGNPVDRKLQLIAR